MVEDKVTDILRGRLRRIRPEVQLKVEPSDGTRSLANASDVFRGGVYISSFRRMLRSLPTPRMLVDQYEIALEGNSAQLLGNPRQLIWWQEDQFLTFCRNGYPRPTEGEVYLFPLLRDGNWIVATIREREGTLSLFGAQFYKDVTQLSPGMGHRFFLLREP